MHLNLQYICEFLLHICGYWIPSLFATSYMCYNFLTHPPSRLLRSSSKEIVGKKLAVTSKKGRQRKMSNWCYPQEDKILHTFIVWDWAGSSRSHLGELGQGWDQELNWFKLNILQPIFWCEQSLSSLSWDVVTNLRLRWPQYDPRLWSQLKGGFSQWNSKLFNLTIRASLKPSAWAFLGPN